MPTGFERYYRQLRWGTTQVDGGEGGEPPAEEEYPKDDDTDARGGEMHDSNHPAAGGTPVGDDAGEEQQADEDDGEGAPSKAVVSLDANDLFAKTFMYDLATKQTKYSRWYPSQLPGVEQKEYLSHLGIRIDDVPNIGDAQLKPARELIKFWFETKNVLIAQVIMWLHFMKMSSWPHDSPSPNGFAYVKNLRAIRNFALLITNAMIGPTADLKASRYKTKTNAWSKFALGKLSTGKKNSDPSIKEKFAAFVTWFDQNNPLKGFDEEDEAIIISDDDGAGTSKPGNPALKRPAGEAGPAADASKKPKPAAAGKEPAAAGKAPVAKDDGKGKPVPAVVVAPKQAQGHGGAAGGGASGSKPAAAKPAQGQGGAAHDPPPPARKVAQHPVARPPAAQPPAAQPPAAHNPPQPPPPATQPPPVQPPVRHNPPAPPPRAAPQPPADGANEFLEPPPDEPQPEEAPAPAAHGGGAHAAFTASEQAREDVDNKHIDEAKKQMEENVDLIEQLDDLIKYPKSAAKEVHEFAELMKTLKEKGEKEMEKRQDSVKELDKAKEAYDLALAAFEKAKVDLAAAKRRGTDTSDLSYTKVMKKYNDDKVAIILGYGMMSKPSNVVKLEEAISELRKEITQAFPAEGGGGGDVEMHDADGAAAGPSTGGRFGCGYGVSMEAGAATTSWAQESIRLATEALYRGLPPRQPAGRR